MTTNRYEGGELSNCLKISRKVETSKMEKSADHSKRQTSHYRHHQSLNNTTYYINIHYFRTNPVMLSVEHITGVLSSLSLANQPLEGDKFVSTIVSHVNAEPKTLKTLVPKLVEQVASYL